MCSVIITQLGVDFKPLVVPSIGIAVTEELEEGP
jgi:hypothetical protein